MYRTQIKKQYREGFETFWKTDPENGFVVLMNMGKMSLIYCEETGLLLDIYNNKLDNFKQIDPVGFTVEAKNLDYADRFDLHGEFEVVGYESESPVLLKLENGIGETRYMMPSRLRVVNVEGL